MDTSRSRPIIVEYAPDGLIGVLTPQANTTVEPELNILCPRGLAFLNARLMSDKPTIEARLIDYIESFDSQRRQFGNAPLNALAIATTGVSYLIGAEREDNIVRQVHQQTGIPFITTAIAVCDALNALKVQRIALVSPYPETLTRQSEVYWRSRGFSISTVINAAPNSSAFHPIYAMTSRDILPLIDTLENDGADAIVMLGTGMPTLSTLRHFSQPDSTWRGPPALSCMLALAWRSSLAATESAPDIDNIKNWMAGVHWAARLN